MPCRRLFLRVLCITPGDFEDSKGMRPSLTFSEGLTDEETGMEQCVKDIRSDYRVNFGTSVSYFICDNFYAVLILLTLVVFVQVT